MTGRTDEAGEGSKRHRRRAQFVSHGPARGQHLQGRGVCNDGSLNRPPRQNLELVVRRKARFTFVSNSEGFARSRSPRRAGINLQGNPVENVRRGKLLDAVKWADGVYQECLRESPLGERARLYVGDRKLTGPTVRAFGLGYAPADFGWLVRAARAADRDLEILQEVGLIGTGRESGGYYDRFRDRVMFPIRDPRGQTVGFGGRILPDSPSTEPGPKYYNSSETPLFLKKELLYGLDMARNAGATEGYLAVVEGYTDVMMAHQHGVHGGDDGHGTERGSRAAASPVVPKVVLSLMRRRRCDGCDRALEILSAARNSLPLPRRVDPCDLLVAQAPNHSVARLCAVDARFQAEPVSELCAQRGWN